MNFKNLDIAIPAKLINIHDGIDTSPLTQIALEIVLTKQNLNAFQIQAQFHLEGSWITLYSEASDYITPSGILIGASGDLTTLVADSSGWFIMNVRGLHKVKVQVSCSETGGIVNLYGGGF